MPRSTRTGASGAPSLAVAVAVAVAAAVFAVVFAGCQELPDVALGTCGNGVLEQGEDCEAPVAGAQGVHACGAPDTEHACRFLCEPDDPERGCPTGYVCGGDGRCRQPSNRFVRHASVPALVRELAVGDVDGDHRADVVVASGTTVQVLYGSRDADLAVRATARLAAPATALRVVRVDGDAAADLVVGTALGVETYLGGAGRMLDPVSYPLRAFPPSSSRAIGAGVALTPGAVGEHVLLAWGDRVGFPLAPGAPELPLPANPGGTATAAALVASLPVARAAAPRGGDPASDPDVELALGYDGGGRVVIYRATGAPVAIGDPGVALPLPPGHRLRGASALAFGHLDGDDCLDLIAHVDRPVGHGLVVFRGAAGGPTGCAGAFEPPVDVVLANSPFAGASTRLLAAADVDGDGVVDLVTDRGVYRVAGAGPWVAAELAAAGEGWDGALVADLNGDGRADVAGFRAGRPDVEVLINAGAAFNRFVVATIHPVEALATGDFDGDLTPDLAIVEVDATGDAPMRTIGVSFGTSLGPPGPCVVMDRFAELAGLVAAPVVAGTGAADAVTDLVALEPRADALAATVLLGSGARAMTSPLVLAHGGVHTPRALVVAPLGGDPGPDLFAVGSRADGPGVVETAFLLHGDGAGGFALPSEGVALPWALGFATDDAAWAAGDLDGDGIAEIAAVERRGAAAQVLVFTPGAPGDPRYATIETGEVAHTIELIDLDGDGDLDLVVGVASRTSAALLVGWNRSGALRPLAPLGAGAGCFDVVAAELDGDPLVELVALCHAGDGRGGLELRELHAPEPETVLLEGVLDAVPGDRTATLDAGDVNGDGLTDLILRVRAGEASELLVFLQRDRRDPIQERP